MALSANTQIEIRSGGSDTSGGGFNPSNANMATDLTTTTNTGNTASPEVSSASYNFVANDVGAYLFIKSGTNWIPGWYQIASVASNKATLTAGIGTSILYSTTTNIGTLNTVVGVATVGTPTSGTWTIDYSQQNGAGITFTDMVIDGTTNTKFTSAGNPVGKNFIGNLLSVTSGTGFTVQVVEIVSTVTTTATCDRSLGTLSSTGGNGKLGGALASTGGLGAFLVAQGTNWVNGLTVHVKSAAGITSTTANFSGGLLKMDVANITGKRITIAGYQTTRLDDGTPPVIDVGAQTACTMIVMGGSYNNQNHFIRNIEVDGNGNSNVVGFNGTGSYQSNDNLYKCKATACTTGFTGTNTNRVACVATSCTTGFSGGNNVSCEAISGGTGFSQPSCAYKCLARSNTAVGFDLGVNFNTIMVGCSSIANGGDGFRNQSYDIWILHGNIAASNTGYGFNSGVGLVGMLAVNNAAYSNTAGNYANEYPRAIGAVVPTGDPFVNAASFDYRPDATANEGASLRAAFMGPPSQTNNDDIGAVQHSDPAGGGASSYMY